MGRAGISSRRPMRLPVDGPVRPAEQHLELYWQGRFRPRWHHAAATSLIVLISLTVAIVACLRLRAVGQCNRHPLAGGSAYRSGQMTATQLREFAAQSGLKSVINLRGDQQGVPWYDAEVRLCDELGIERYDICLSADCPPDAQTFARLVSVMGQCERPVLIHCRAGSDRTGFACVAWRLLGDSASIGQAMKELSLYYWHIPFTFADTRFRAFFGEYRKWLDVNRRQHSPASFRRWTLQRTEGQKPNG